MTLITFKLPKASKWKVNPGDKISAGQVVAKIKIKGSQRSLALAKLLGVPSKKIGKFLLKKVGDEVNCGEPLAQKKALFKKLTIFSPCSGRLLGIDETQGNLILEEEGEWQDLISDVSGKVLKLSPEVCEVEFEGEVLPGIRAAGVKASGKIKYFGDKIRVSDLSKENQGEIIAASEIGLAALEKALALEIAGIVLVDISEENFDKIYEGKAWEIGESCVLSLPLLVVSEDDFAKIKNYQERKAILDPEEKRLIILKEIND